MLKHPNRRVVVLIDTQNMYHSAKHLFGARLHFSRLVEMLTKDREMVRAFAYVAKSKTGEEKGFLDALVAAGIELRIKDVIEFSSGERKADWDVGMAIDAVRFSDRVDVVCLVTGDGDFVPLVEYLHGKGVIVQVAAFSESTSKLLRDACDEYFDISEHKRELLMRSGGARNAIARVASLSEPHRDTEEDSGIVTHLARGADPEEGNEGEFHDEEELEGRVTVPLTRGRRSRVRITT
jgi:uncharacterized LabA/DUF88 family protein